MRFQPDGPAPDRAAHPKLQFVIPHFGAGYLREALMLCDLCPNVCLDTSSSNSWMRYESLDLKACSGGPGRGWTARLLFGTDPHSSPRLAGVDLQRAASGPGGAGRL